jgi:hypothetical protein
VPHPLFVRYRPGHLNSGIAVSSHILEFGNFGQFTHSYHESATFEKTIIDSAGELTFGNPRAVHHPLFVHVRNRPRHLEGIRELRSVHTFVLRIGHFWETIIDSPGKLTFGRCG